MIDTSGSVLVITRHPWKVIAQRFPFYNTRKYVLTSRKKSTTVAESVCQVCRCHSVQVNLSQLDTTRSIFHACSLFHIAFPWILQIKWTSTLGDDEMQPVFSSQQTKSEKDPGNVHFYRTSRLFMLFRSSIYSAVTIVIHVGKVNKQRENGSSWLPDLKSDS